MTDLALAELSRRVAEAPGDKQAAAALAWARSRSGLCPWCLGPGLAVWGGNDQRICCCSLCWAKRSPVPATTCPDCPHRETL